MQIGVCDPVRCPLAVDLHNSEVLVDTNCLIGIREKTTLELEDSIYEHTYIGHQLLNPCFLHV